MQEAQVQALVRELDRTSHNWDPTQPNKQIKKEFFNIIYVFIFGCAGSLQLLGLFSDRGRRGPLFIEVHVLLIAVGSLLLNTGSRCTGFSSCGTWAQQLWFPGSRVQAQQLWRTGLVAPWQVGSSWIRDRTRVSCIGRQILYHWATREGLYKHIFFKAQESWK